MAGLETIAESQRILSEITGRIFYSHEDIADLTIDDITQAVESGGLKPFFESSTEWGANVNRHIEWAQQVRSY